MTVLAGPSGSMKTLTALNVAMNIKVPTLYFSSDSDEYTMATRLLSRITSTPSQETGGWIRSRKDFAAQVLKETSHVRWCFDSAPSIETLWLNLEAFHEVHGSFPHMTVIDILMDIDDGSGEVTQNYWTTMAKLKDLARESKTALVIAHHTSESAKGGEPPPKSALMGKISQLPVMVITLWGDSVNGTLDLAIVKNRMGKDDSLGGYGFRMQVDPSTCKLEEIPTNTTTLSYEESMGAEGK